MRARCSKKFTLRRLPFSLHAKQDMQIFVFFFFLPLLHEKTRFYAPREFVPPLARVSFLKCSWICPFWSKLRCFCTRIPLIVEGTLCDWNGRYAHITHVDVAIQFFFFFVIAFIKRRGIRQLRHCLIFFGFSLLAQTLPLFVNRLTKNTWSTYSAHLPTVFRLQKVSV